jgi:hypothetical protein
MNVNLGSRPLVILGVTLTLGAFAVTCHGQTSFQRSLPATNSDALRAAHLLLTLPVSESAQSLQDSSGNTAADLLRQAADLDRQANEASEKARKEQERGQALGALLGRPFFARAKQWRDKEQQLRNQAATLRAQATQMQPANQNSQQPVTAVGNAESTSDAPRVSALPQRLDHQWCSLNYPQDWHAYTSSISAIVLSPEPQPEDYTRINAAIPHYGVIIQAAHLGVVATGTSESEFQALLLYLKTKEEGWGDPLSYSTQMVLNGRPARAAEVARSYFDHGKRIQQRAWVVAVQPPGAGLGRGNYYVFYAAFLAPEEEFQAKKPLFEQIANTIVVNEIGAPPKRKPAAQNPVPGSGLPAQPAPSRVVCSGTPDAGYSILLQGHLYKVKASGSGANKALLFLDETGKQVTNPELVQPLASAVWTRDNVIFLRMPAMVAV